MPRWLSAVVIVTIVASIVTAIAQGGPAQAAKQRTAARPSRTAAPACRARDLSGRLLGSSGAQMMVAFQAFVVQSDRACTVRGAPNVTLLDSQGRAEGRIIAGQVSSEMPSVTLSSKWPAYFEVGYDSPDVPTPPCHMKVYAIRVSVPGEPDGFAISLRREPVVTCPDGGRYSMGFTSSPPSCVWISGKEVLLGLTRAVRTDGLGREASLARKATAQHARAHIAC